MASEELTDLAHILLLACGINLSRVDENTLAGIAHIEGLPTFKAEVFGAEGGEDSPEGIGLTFQCVRQYKEEEQDMRRKLEEINRKLPRSETLQMRFALVEGKPYVSAVGIITVGVEEESALGRGIEGTIAFFGSIQEHWPIRDT